MSRFARAQLAARRLCFDGRGGLNDNARTVAADLKKFCKVGGSLIAYNPVTGAVDEAATVAMAARREVWDRLVRLLQLDAYAETNIREEE